MERMFYTVRTVGVRGNAASANRHRLDETMAETVALRERGGCGVISRAVP
jgi:hypothetical protein